MTAYELMRKKFNDRELAGLSRTGLVRSSFSRNVKAYECYRQYRDKGLNKENAAMLAARDMKVGINTIKRIVATMERRVILRK